MDEPFVQNVVGFAGLLLVHLLGHGSAMVATGL